MLAIIIIGMIFIYQYVRSCGRKDALDIEDSPLHVEQVRAIIELNTITFRDEVVADTVEYYRNMAEQIAGNIEKMKSPEQAKYGIQGSNVKRRLSLIMKGELLYGVDLKTQEFTITPKDKQLIVRIPEPRLLSVSLTPQNTQVFMEHGIWKDYERRALQSKARRKMIASGERLHLKEKAKEPLERLLRQLIRTDKAIVVEYYH